MPSSLFLTGTLEFGGSEKKVVKIANALAESGHNVGLAYLNKPDPLLASIDSKVPVTYLDRKGKSIGVWLHSDQVWDLQTIRTVTFALLAEGAFVQVFDVHTL